MSPISQAFRELWWFRRTVLLIITPVLIFAILPAFLHSRDFDTKQGMCLCMILLMVVYWCTDTLHITVVALIPLVLAPPFGLLKADEVARLYFKDIIALYTATLIAAAAVEETGLHRRLAINMLKKVGTNPRFLILGFMLATWFMAMWVQNGAAAALMVPIMQGIIEQFQKGANEDDSSQVKIELGFVNEAGVFDDREASKSGVHDGGNNETPETLEEGAADDQKVFGLSEKWSNLAKALSLAICYSSSIGGIATLTGTGPNLVLASTLESLPESQFPGMVFGINFSSWMGYAFPVSLIVLLGSWVTLQIFFIGCSGNTQLNPEERRKVMAVIDREHAALGRVKFNEIITLVHFTILVLLWVTRNLGGFGGWENLFEKGYVRDSTAAMLIALLLFTYPNEMPDYVCCRGDKTEISKSHPKPRKALLEWRDVVHKVPWGLLLLFGGGFALAECIEVTGLSVTLRNSFSFLESWPLWGVIMFLCTITAFLTEITTNTAMSTVLLPLCANLAAGLQIHPFFLMLPVCISCSYAFMLPVATTPNAIVLTAGHITMKDMAKVGFGLNIFGVLVSTLSILTWGQAMFGLAHLTYHNNTIINSTATINSTVY